MRALSAGHGSPGLEEQDRHLADEHFYVYAAIGDACFIELSFACIVLRFVNDRSGLLRLAFLPRVRTRTETPSDSTGPASASATIGSYRFIKLLTCCIVSRA